MNIPNNPTTPKEAKPADFAVLRHTSGPFSSKQWFYSIDGKPECKAIAAALHLKSVGFTTEESGAYMRSLQPQEHDIPMSAEEERAFNP